MLGVDAIEQRSSLEETSNCFLLLPPFGFPRKNFRGRRQFSKDCVQLEEMPAFPLTSAQRHTYHFFLC